MNRDRIEGNWTKDTKENTMKTTHRYTALAAAVDGVVTVENRLTIEAKS